jgi:hypothetical protein
MGQVNLAQRCASFVSVLTDGAGSHQFKLYSSTEFCAASADFKRDLCYFVLG